MVKLYHCHLESMLDKMGQKYIYHRKEWCFSMQTLAFMQSNSRCLSYVRERERKREREREREIERDWQTKRKTAHQKKWRMVERGIKSRYFSPTRLLLSFIAMTLPAPAPPLAHLAPLAPSRPFPPHTPTHPPQGPVFLPSKSMPHRNLTRISDQVKVYTVTLECNINGKNTGKKILWVL